MLPTKSGAFILPFNGVYFALCRFNAFRGCFNAFYRLGYMNSHNTQNGFKTRFKGIVCRSGVRVCLGMDRGEKGRSPEILKKKKRLTRKLRESRLIVESRSSFQSR
jgi:hypothetical protein